MRAQRALIRSTALLVALASLPAARIPAFPAQASAIVILLALWRMGAGSDGRAFLGRRAHVLLQSVGPAVVLVLLYVSARGATPPIVAILLLVTTVQGISLLARQAPPMLFRLLLLSTTQVAGAAFVMHDAVALGLSVLYMLTLVMTTLFFERRLAEIRASQDRQARGRQRVPGDGALPFRAWGGTLAGLAVVGAFGGGLLYLAAPRGLTLIGRDGRGAQAEDTDGAEAAAAELGGGSFTGPDASSKGIRLGDVGRIKKDLTPYFEVSLPMGRRPFLRENTYDHYADATWTAWNGPGVSAPRTIGPPSGEDGWLYLGREDDDRRGYHLGLRLYRGTHRRLYLDRDCVRLRILRDGRARSATLVQLDNEQLDAKIELRPEDRIEARIVPPRADPDLLQRARSNPETSPRASFVQLPARAQPLVSLARQVVGNETNPYRRAQRLVAWFDSDAFAYTLNMPVVDTKTPVVDFALRVRRGHCEYFASALTLMLRALGHPARIVKGFRGGDAQEGRGTWIVRGSHCHAWTEMHFEGVGWIPFDATPPDNAAVDADSVTQAADASGPETSAWVARLLGYGTSDHQALVAVLARGFQRVVVRPVAFLFSPRGYYIGVPLVLLLVLRLGRRRQRRHLAKRAGVRSPDELKGSYGAMLGLLARRGIRRARHETPREFVLTAARRVPDARDALEGITGLHEGEHYARQTASPEARRKARENLHALETTLDAQRGKGRRVRP